MRFDTKVQADKAAYGVNKMFAKRGHTNPVVQAFRGAYWWEVREIPVALPDPVVSYPVLDRKLSKDEAAAIPRCAL